MVIQPIWLGIGTMIIQYGKGKRIDFILHLPGIQHHCLTFFIGQMPFSTFFLNLELFKHIFKHINAPLLGYFVRPRNVGSRNNKGCFQHPSNQQNIRRQLEFLLTCKQVPLLHLVCTIKPDRLVHWDSEASGHRVVLQDGPGHQPTCQSRELKKKRTFLFTILNFFCWYKLLH